MRRDARGRWALTALVWALALACLALVAGGCSRGDESVSPESSGELPPLVLRDDTPGLLLTWVDDRGDTHTEVAPKDVPAAARELVRVVVADSSDGQGTLLYVADLRTPGGDGAYAVRSMRRAEWEDAIAHRRAAHVARSAPPPDDTGAPRASPPLGDPRAVHGLTAIVYGASWCRPCHDAAAHLKHRGVAVIERDIDEDPSARGEMQTKLERAGLRGGSIPVIDLGGIVLQGFSPGAVDRAIQRALGGTQM